jgi:hypothetical protein
MRPCSFSIVSARSRSGAGVHSAQGGLRPEGQGDVGFECRLVALDDEEVIAAALDDGATDLRLREDRIARDDGARNGQGLQQLQSRRYLMGVGVHPQLPNHALQALAAGAR